MVGLELKHRKDFRLSTVRIEFLYYVMKSNYKEQTCDGLQ